MKPDTPSQGEAPADPTSPKYPSAVQAAADSKAYEYFGTGYPVGGQFKIACPQGHLHKAADSVTTVTVDRDGEYTCECTDKTCAGDVTPFLVARVKERGYLAAGTHLFQEYHDNRRHNTNNHPISAGRSKGVAQVTQLNPKGADQGFQLIPVAEAMKGIGPIDWRINDFIPFGGIVELFGPSSQYKTFMAMDLACCMASGTEWHGEEVRQGPVIYVAGEGNNYLMRRTAAWCIHNDVDPTALQMHVSKGSMGLTDAASVLSVIEAVDTASKTFSAQPAMIVIDTLARNFGQGDENSTQDMNTVIRHSEAFLERFPGVTVLLIHHTGLSASDRSRGSSALYAALDAQFNCTTIDEGGEDIRFECKKMKDAPRSPIRFFTAEQVDLDFTEKNGSAATSVVLSVDSYSSTVASEKDNFYKKHPALANGKRKNALPYMLQFIHLNPDCSAVARWESVEDSGMKETAAKSMFREMKLAGILSESGRILPYGREVLEIIKTVPVLEPEGGKKDGPLQFA